VNIGQLVVGSIPTAETGVKASHGCDPIVDHAELFVVAYPGVRATSQPADDAGSETDIPAS
jgi:hypothetical protein